MSDPKALLRGFIYLGAEKAENVAKNPTEFPEMNYYRVVVFYQLDLPIFRSLFEFQVSGDTKIMYRSTGYTKLPNGTFIEG